MKKFTPEISLRENEVVIERMFDAPISIVWDVWTNPVHLAKWWGPHGFTNPIVEFDFKVGGSYRIVMRSPDGVDYPVIGKFISIEPGKQFTMSDLVDEHPEDWAADVMKQAGITGSKDQLNSLFTASFEEIGFQTKVTLVTKFQNNQIRDGFANSGMKEGWSESFEKLDEFALPKPNQVQLAKEYSFPIDLVFRSFGDANGLSKWWGPNGYTITTVKMDFRVGGVWQFTMHGPDGTDYPNLITYKEIKTNERLVYLHGSELGKEDHFFVTIHFESKDPGKTRVNMVMEFPNEAARNAVLEFGAVELGKQTLAKLENLLEKES